MSRLSPSRLTGPRSLAAPGGGPRAPMQPQEQEARCLADPMAGDRSTIRNYNKYLRYQIMLMLRRSKEKIIAQILEVCQISGITKTNVVYRANMSFKMAKPYLNLLIGRGLLETVPGKLTIYKTTSKGKRALEALRAVDEIIPERLD